MHKHERAKENPRPIWSSIRLVPRIVVGMDLLPHDKIPMQSHTWKICLLLHYYSGMSFTTKFSHTFTLRKFHRNFHQRALIRRHASGLSPDEWPIWTTYIGHGIFPHRGEGFFVVTIKPFCWMRKNIPKKCTLGKEKHGKFLQPQLFFLRASDWPLFPNIYLVCIVCLLHFHYRMWHLYWFRWLRNCDTNEYPNILV